MTGRRPVIGITAAIRASRDDGSPRFAARERFAAAIVAAGGAPVLVPAVTDHGVLEAAFHVMDGLLLPGGVDLAPELYGERRIPELERVDAALDEAELRLTQWSLERDLPILGVCRGIQALNVAAGGSLYQDIGAQVPDALDHRFHLGESRAQYKHTVQPVTGSRLAAIAGLEPFQVNSLHHQAVKAAAPGFVVTAAAPDGIVEAMERPGSRFVLAVQWHPEDLFENDARAAALFRAFVVAAEIVEK